MVKVATKICITCHACKPVNLFRKKRNQCKACEATKSSEYYHNNKEKQREYYHNNKEKRHIYEQTNKEKIAAYRRKYRQKNKDKIAARNRKYYQKNKKKLTARCSKYRQSNREILAAKQREYQQNNKERCAAKDRKYRQNNREKIAARCRKYYQEKRRNDPEYILKSRLRTRMYNAVKRAGLDKKCDSSSELLGISYQGLKEWLEPQFTEGMTWENRSDWHVDHIVPCDAFDMTVEENQRICFWYKNLQPLWANDNIQKSNTYTEEDKQALISAYCNQ